MPRKKIEHRRYDYSGFRPYSSLQNLTSDDVVAAAIMVEVQNARYSTFNRFSKWEEVTGPSAYLPRVEGHGIQAQQPRSFMPRPTDSD